MSGQLMVDTVKYAKNSTFIMKRGLSPYQNSYDCDPWGVATCHSIPDGSQSVRERPIAVTLNPPSPSKRVWNFAAGQADIIFTASRTPDSLTIAGNRTSMPITMTLWQWIGADSTRLGVTGYCGMAAWPRCEFYPKESGRMITKGFTGGWEQTSSVTVQCLVYDADPALNDSTSDFSVRTALRDMLDRGNADSSTTAGWTQDHPGSWAHEVGLVTWQLPNGGGFLNIPVDDPNADECQMTIPPSAYDENNPPVPGATVYAVSHAHVVTPGKELFCPGQKVFFNTRYRSYPSQPSDTLNWPGPRRAAGVQDSTHAGSVADWDRVFERNRPTFIVSKNGFAYQLFTLPWTIVPQQHVYRAFGGTASERKCAWAKKYNG
jgi:hypothetical protein